MTSESIKINVSKFDTTIKGQYLCYVKVSSSYLLAALINKPSKSVMTGLGRVGSGRVGSFLRVTICDRRKRLSTASDDSLRSASLAIKF